jgi:hypothetical protein
MKAKIALSTTFAKAIPFNVPSGDGTSALVIHADLLFVPNAKLLELRDNESVRTFCAGIRDVRDAATGASVLELEGSGTPAEIRDALIDGDHGSALATRMVIYYLSELPGEIAKNSPPSPSN